MLLTGNIKKISIYEIFQASEMSINSDDKDDYECINDNDEVKNNVYSTLSLS